MKAVVTKIYRTPRKFRATNQCIKCGTCKSVCPTDNISISEQKVLWGNNCTQCLACIHWCPVQAINLWNSPKQKKYHHPDIKVKDMRLR